MTKKTHTDSNRRVWGEKGEESETFFMLEIDTNVILAVFFLVTSDVKYSTCTDSSMGTHRFILFLNRYTHHTVSHIQIMV